MNLFKHLEKNARKNRKTIILPESYDPRVRKAAKEILKRKLAKVILISTDEQIKGFKDSDDLDIIDVNFSAQFIEEYIQLRKGKKVLLTNEQAAAELKDPMRFACMLLKNNFANGVISGSVYSTSDVLRSAIQIVGLAEGNKTVSSFFLFNFPKSHPLKKKVLAYADCGVLPSPTAEQLSDIAIQTSQNYKKLTGIKPKTAFLSFSTKGSAIHESLENIIKAYNITKEREPSLECEGELQFDAAFVPAVAERKNPKGKIKGDANVFIFPDLNAGNIAYKITERIGGASATGPIVQGLAKPIMDLSRGCNANDIVNMAMVLAGLA